MALFGKKKKQTEEVQTASETNSTLDLIKEAMAEAEAEKHNAANAQTMPTDEQINAARNVLAQAQKNDAAKSIPQAAKIPRGANVGVNVEIDTSVLKGLIAKFTEDKSEENMKAVMACLQDPKTLVCVPAQIITSEENKEKMKQSGGNIQLDGDLQINPVLLTDNEGKKVFPIFSGEDTIPDEIKTKTPKINMPFAQCVAIMKDMEGVETFALDPFTANIRIGISANPQAPAQIPNGANVGVNVPVDNSVIKGLIDKFNADRNQENMQAVVECLQKPETLVCIPAQIMTTQENQEKLQKGGNVEIKGEMRINPMILTDKEGKKIFPIFSGEDTIPEDVRKSTPKVNMPFAQCINMLGTMTDVEAFVLDPFTANIRIGVTKKTDAE